MLRKSLFAASLLYVIGTAGRVATAQPLQWETADIGDVGVEGRASADYGVWTITAAGSDIWGSEDSFRFVYRRSWSDTFKLQARVKDLTNTNEFAKAGIMVRSAITANSPSVILDLKPNGELEYMARTTSGGEMEYIGGATTDGPVWLDLQWTLDGSAPATTIVPFISSDRHHWTQVGRAVTIPLLEGRYLFAGAAVTSHDPAQLNTAHIDGLSLMPLAFSLTDLGETGATGNVAVDFTGAQDFTIEAAGTDVWGQSDSFTFIHRPSPFESDSLLYWVRSLEDTDPFAKAGVMCRESDEDGTVRPDAPSVILDVKPSGEVEFMARLCAGCETNYVAGGQIIFPNFIRLKRNGSTFSAGIGDTYYSDKGFVGQIDVPMSRPVCGLAVTSHNLSRTTRAVLSVVPT